MADPKQYAIDVTIKLAVQGSYGSTGAPPISIVITGDNVPKDVDPVVYLRDRVLEELDRKTVVAKVTRESLVDLSEPEPGTEE
ncbi:MAG: hypothetical protein ACYTFQ_00185 [Planctomycetota bacterium]|jgi:hypothetical protein